MGLLYLYLHSAITGTHIHSVTTKSINKMRTYQTCNNKYVNTLLRWNILNQSIPYLTLSAKSFLRSQHFFSQSKISPHFIQKKSSLPHSQELTIFPHHEPDQTSPCPRPTSCRSILILSSQTRLSSKWSLSLFLSLSPPKLCMHLSCLSYEINIKVFCMLPIHADQIRSLIQ